MVGRGGHRQESHWVWAAWGSRETWAVARVRVVTGRHCWRQVCCPCAGRRRDRFQGGGCGAGCPAGNAAAGAVRGDCAADGTDRGHDRRVLPVTPFPLWRLVPVKQSGAGDDDAGWVLSLQSTPIRFGFPPRRPPGSLIPAGSKGRRGGDDREEEGGR